MSIPPFITIWKIDCIGGESKLFSLDVAAHRALIEGKWLKEESIPKRATDLAARFSNAVAPLFASTPYNVEDELFHTWGEHSECWKDRRAHLQEIFQTALTLKADSVVTKSRYGFEIYPPGTTFVGYGTNVKETSRLKCGSYWMHASFHVYDADIIGNSKQSTLVQTENFVKVSEGRASAKYSKDLLFPKRSPEVISSRITEVVETLIPKLKSMGQSKVIIAPEAPLVPLPRCKECGEEFPAVALLRRHEKNSESTLDLFLQA